MPKVVSFLSIAEDMLLTKSINANDYGIQIVSSIKYYARFISIYILKSSL